MFRRLALCPLVAALALLAASGTALGDGALLPDQPLSSGDAGTPTVAMAPNGYAAAAWEEPLAGGQFAVGVATRPPGGDWSSPQLLGTNANDKYGVNVAVDAGGDLAVGWEEIVSPNALAFVATRAAGGASFAGPEQLNDATSVSNPVVGVAASGRVTLLYNPASALATRDFAAGSSALSAPPQTLDDGRASACFGSDLLAVAPSGDVVAGADCGGAVFALRRAGSWSVSPLVASTSASCPGTSTYNTPSAVAIDVQGHAVGLLTHRVVQTTGFDPTTCIIFPPTETDTLQLVLPVGGFMTPLVGAVATASGTGYAAPMAFPDVGVSPSGILAAWTATDGSAMRLRVRDFALDGTARGTEQTLDPAAYAFGPRLAVGDDGRALLTWSRYPSTTGPRSLEVATRPPGGAFGPPAEVTSDGSENFTAPVALDAAGDGAIAYQNDTAPRRVHVRGFDAGAPVLSGVSIPASASPGAMLGFAASAFDVWGPVTLSWSFGDGASGSGGAPTHAFASAGRYTVTVTATDAAGNASSQSGTVTVASAVSGTVRITSASLTHKTFRVGRSSTPLTGRTAAHRRAHRIPVGTTFRFGLFVPRTLVAGPPANVRIEIARATGGRLSGHRCVKPTHKLARHRRCTRFVLVGTLRRTAHDGVNKVTFSGRIGRKPLAPGSYRATLTPSWGATKGAPRALRFRVVR